MLVLRRAGVLAGIAVGAGIVLATGNRKFLRFALQLLKSVVILALRLFALIALERLATLL